MLNTFASYLMKEMYQEDKTQELLHPLIDSKLAANRMS